VTSDERTIGSSDRVGDEFRGTEKRRRNVHENPTR
jgi:hypothetical protein